MQLKFVCYIYAPNCNFCRFGGKTGPAKVPQQGVKNERNLPKWYPKAFEKQSNALEASMAAKMVPNAAQTVLQRVENA